MQPDHTSAVAQYSFGDTLAEQEAQLQTNPLLQRFRTTRQAQAGDPVRPIYHFCNPDGRLNDPNGLCFWQGRWHLFYQAFPPEDPRPHWAHAVSDDLIHWRDLPYAIYPHPEHGCWSGASLVDGDRVIVHYYGHQTGNVSAISRDPLLLNWQKVPGGIPEPKINEPSQPYRVYDPCIWKKDGAYYSLSGGTLPTGPRGLQRRANFLFRSEDLETWEYLHPFVEDDLFSVNGDDGACPYFWPIGDKHMLLYYSHRNGGQYLIGDYDQARDKLIARDYGRFNFGASWPGGIHAPSATPDGKGGLIAIFNVNWGMPSPGWSEEERQRRHFGCWEGQQLMSLPRRLSLSTSGDVQIEPAGDIESLRGRHTQIADCTIKGNSEIVFDQLVGNAIELNLEVETNGAPLIELDVLRSPDQQEHTRIAFYRDRSVKPLETGGAAGTPPNNEGTYSLVALDSSHASIQPEARSRPPEIAPVFLAPEENLKMRVFVDKSIVEVFVNDRQCLAVRVYPGRQDSVGVALRAVGRDVRLVVLDAWEMKSIYSPMDQ
ncbi:MAG: glycoside hydrolase family 32 protein [Gemmatimonadota bacterium]|nr:glycoside hydrolase family 32 protein [Gemmatimonadota bacterium]